MPRIVSKAFIVIAVAAAAVGAFLWVRAAPNASVPPTGTPAPTTAAPGTSDSLGGLSPSGPGLSPGETLSAAGGDPKAQMRAWVQSSLDSLGVGMQLPIPENEKGRGVTVATVKSGSPVQQGGIRAGDTIISFGGQSVGTPMDLAGLIAQSKPGTRYPVAVQREGKSVTLQVTGVSPSKLSRPAMPTNPGAQPGGRGGLSFGR